MSDSLIQKLEALMYPNAEGDMIQEHYNEAIDQAIAIIRQHESARCEIRYNRNQLYKDIGDAIEKHDKRSDDESRDEIDYIIEAILPYLRQPEPVIGKVSLKKAALGVAEYSQCRICELSEKPCIDHFDEAKFVLDAAGVNYVD